MKKLISFFIAVCIVFSTAVPFSSFAADVNGDKGMYKVNETVYADSYMLVSLDDDTYPDSDDGFEEVLIEDEYLL